MPSNDGVPATLATQLAAYGIAPKVIRSVWARLMLLALDDRWSDHLAFAADQRETIVFERLGGQDPVTEFRRRVGGAFADFFETSKHAAHQTALQLAESGQFHADRESLQGPSSTWTYLVDDTVLANDLTLIGNIGMAAGAAFYWPLFLAWAMVRRFKRPHS